MCIGSSTSHVVSFGGVALKLKGVCSYSLLRSGGAELVLNTNKCRDSPGQICMKSLELREGGTRVVLGDDMKVKVMERPCSLGGRGVHTLRPGCL